jgi:O-antigen ligase
MIALARARAIRITAVAIAMVAATLVLFAVLVVPNDPIERLLRTDFIAIDADPSTSRRATQLATALELASRNPLFGMGFGGYAFGYTALNEGVLPSTTPHNGPLHLAAQGGIVGLGALVAYYLVILLVAWQALRRRRDAWGIASVATATVLIVLDQFFPYLLTHDVGTVAALMLAAMVQMGRVECPS